MTRSPPKWRRGPRSSFALTHEPGVYALFLRQGSALPGIEAGEHGLLYIGLAANSKGLKGRCHFNARTRNHSPRKSLAVLLMNALDLQPVLVTKPNSANTWALEPSSEARLSAWMHEHLELAVEICADPDSRETELVARYGPPLNLTKCAQGAQQQRVSAARAGVMARLKGRASPAVGVEINRGGNERSCPSTSALLESSPSQSEHDAMRRLAGAEMDTAEAIAARYRLNAKTYRQLLRECVSWYRKPQTWTFPTGSNEWRDMIAIAEEMARRQRAI